MLKANKKTLIITSILTLLPILIGVVCWKRLPDSMATHFGLDNEANGFSSKAIAVFGLPVFLLALQWFAAFVTSRDPKNQNISPKMFTIVLWIVPIISLYTAAMIYPYNLGYHMDISLAAELLMGVLFIVIGNYLPKARQNYTIGIRIPWTLANEENWNRTHRFAGYLWLVCGILIVVLTLCGVLRLSWMIIAIAAATLAPCVYSFWLHEKKSL